MAAAIVVVVLVAFVSAALALARTKAGPRNAIRTGRFLDMALDACARGELAAGHPAFMGRPERWYEASRFRCTAGHVRRGYVKSEVSGDLCAACLAPCRMTFPGDDDAESRGRGAVGGDV